MHDEDFDREIIGLQNSADPAGMAFAIIKLFHSLDNPSLEIVEKFHMWLLDEEGADRKWYAMKVLFDEIMGDTDEEDGEWECEEAIVSEKEN